AVGGGVTIRVHSFADARRLSPCEREVLGFLIRGLNTSEIAALRGVSRHTVRNQIASLLAKAGVGGRAELVYVCLSHGLDLAAQELRRAPARRRPRGADCLTTIERTTSRLATVLGHDWRATGVLTCLNG